MLNEWTGSRGPVHELAFNACRAALMGKSDVASVRQAVVAFAQNRDILAPDELARREGRVRPNLDASRTASAIQS